MKNIILYCSYKTKSLFDVELFSEEETPAKKKYPAYTVTKEAMSEYISILFNDVFWKGLT